MTNSTPAFDPRSPKSYFYGATGLRAGWRLLIFCAMVNAWYFVKRNVKYFGKDDVGSLLLGIALTFVAFLFASLIMGKMENRTIADYGLPWRKMFRSHFWKGCLLGFVSLTVLLTAMRFAGVFYFGKIGLRGAEILQWAAMYTVAFILVGLREEFENRGYGLFTLSAGIGYWPAAMVTSAYFLYRHTSNAGENWVGLLNVGLFGLLSCLILRRTGNLWMPIGFHAAWDWGESYFYGVADSGAALPGHLLNSSSKGPDLLTGGSVGPEGSIFATLLLVVLWFAVAAVFRETKFPGSSTDGARRVP